MPHTGQPLYVVKIWKVGHGFAFPLYRALLEVLHAAADDLLLIRVHPPYVTFRVAHPDNLLNVERFTDEDLPPEWPKKADAADERGR
jgi:hypothetical protein